MLQNSILQWLIIPAILGICWVEIPMKRVLLVLAVILVGAFIAAGVDSLLGISFQGYAWTAIIHKVIYMAWGALIIKIQDWA